MCLIIMCLHTCTTVYVVYLAVALFGALANHVNIARLNVRYLGCKHEFLSIQYSKSPNKNLAN